MFTHTYETRYGDYKDYETIKPGTVLDIIQDVSTRDSARCGYGIEELRDLKMAWLLQGINVHFEKPVRISEKIEACTAVKSMKGATSERGCILKQNGETVAKSIANWFIFDTEKQRVRKIPAEMAEVYEIHDFADDFFEFVKPDICEIETPEYTVRVSNKDIDTNKHLNNQKGADILMDALPFDFDFNDIKLLYKKTAFLGDELEVCIKQTQNGFYVHTQTKEKEICVAGTFEKL